MILNNTKKYAFFMFALCALIGLQPISVVAMEQPKKGWQSWALIAGGATVLSAAATLVAAYFVRQQRANAQAESVRELNEFAKSEIDARVNRLTTKELVDAVKKNPCMFGYIYKHRLGDLLIEASAQGDNSVVSLLLERKPSILQEWVTTRKDYRYDTGVCGTKAIIAAAERGHGETITLLLEASRLGNDTHHAMRTYEQAMKTNNPKILELCYQRNVWSNEQFDSTQKIFDEYITPGDLKKVECCLAAGWNPRERTLGCPEGALVLALNAGHYKIAQALLRKDPALAKREFNFCGEIFHPLTDVRTIKGVEFLLTLPVDQRPEVTQVPKRSLYSDDEV